MSRIPRSQDVVLPILRDCPELSGVKIGSWYEDIDYREFPLIHIRNLGGKRHSTHPFQLSSSVIEMTCYGTKDLPTTEDMYNDALDALYNAQRRQILTPAGYLHSVMETMGMTQFGSPFQDSWRVQGLIKLGIRPLRH